MTPETLADELVKLNVTELIDLKRVLKEKYGLEETQIVTTVTAEAVVEEIEEQTEFNVTLKKVSEVLAEKMSTIRLIKEITGLDLKGAKELSDNAPSLILEKTTKANAEGVKTRLEELHAIIEIA